MSMVNLVTCLIYSHVRSTYWCFWGALFSGLHFYTLSKTLIACRARQLNFFFSGNIVKQCAFQEELRNRFNIISEERVKFSEQNSENLMKIGWKIRKLWHFEVSQMFTKHFLTSRYEYANERVDDVIASLFAIYFVHKFLKNSIFCPNLW